MHQRLTWTLVLFLVTALTGSVWAQTYSAPLLGTGEYERIDGTGNCANDPNFIAGVYDTVNQLQAGGNAWGCDSEWGSFAEFDFSDVGTDNPILSATLVLRYTGYGDDAAGLPYLAVYGYTYAGSAVTLPRADLNDQTALDIFAPTSTTNVDISIDVTGHVQDLIESDSFQAGFFVCGVYSEIGYSDLVYFGGAGHTYPPRLLIQTSNPVSDQASSWGQVKALYR